MRSTALPSSHYGDPCRVLEEKQNREANAKKRADAKRPILHAKPGWSEARRRAEELFDFARGGAVSTVQSPAASATEALSGEYPDRT